MDPDKSRLIRDIAFSWPKIPIVFSDTTRRHLDSTPSLYKTSLSDVFQSLGQLRDVARHRMRMRSSVQSIISKCM
jgi:hypothetical protein